MKSIILMTILMTHIGVKENSKEVQHYLESVGLKGDYSWCSAFVNYTLNEVNEKGTGSPIARSYLKWGKPVSKPQLGDIAVFWRDSKSSWTGHVGYYMGTASNGDIIVLGGNQNDEVNITTYPKSKLLGYRRKN